MFFKFEVVEGLEFAKRTELEKITNKTITFASSPSKNGTFYCLAAIYKCL